LPMARSYPAAPAEECPLPNPSAANAPLCDDRPVLPHNRHRRVESGSNVGSQMPSPLRHAACQKDGPRDSGPRARQPRGAATIETLLGKGPIMNTMRHLASPIAKSFSEALRIDTDAGSWIFVAGQVGVAIPSDNKPISFEEE